jgi:hypothetical protein
MVVGVAAVAKRLEQEAIWFGRHPRVRFSNRSRQKGAHSYLGLSWQLPCRYQLFDLMTKYKLATLVV